MIDLEQIGRIPPLYLGNWRVTRLLPVAAATLNLSSPGPYGDERLVTNTQPFIKAGIPSVALTSLPFLTVNLLDDTTVRMARTGVDRNVYYDTYNLLCVYALDLDEELGSPLKKENTIAGRSTEAQR